MDILGVQIHELERPDLIDFFQKLLDGKQKTKVAKLNTEFLIRAARDTDFRNMINQFELKIADGRGVLWAAKYLTLPTVKNQFLRPFQAVWQMVYSGAAIVVNPGYIENPIPDSFPGVEAFELILRVAIEKDVTVYFFGAYKDTLEKAVLNLRQKFPDLKIAGYHDGYDYGDAEVIKNINDSGAAILFVALGCPKQEYWISDNIEKLPNVKIAIGEGGTLDRVANPTKLAPKWLNAIGLEWFWRMFTNKNMNGKGSRFMRIWRAVPVFIIEAVKLKIRN